jgi:hypothetical protein
MKRLFIGSSICICVLLFGAAAVFPQNLFNGPESVAFDSLQNRYLVSNYYDGSIVQVDSDGNQSYFITGLGHCLGNTILNGVIYVSTADSVVMGIDLATAQVVDVFGLTVNNHVDGVTTDTSGFLYVVDTGGRILKIDLTTDDYSIFVSSGLSTGLQDIIFDKENNRLLAVSYFQNAPVQGIDLSDSSVYVVVNTSFGNFDGITRDQFGNTYVATYSNSGSIYRYDPEFALGPELISSGHQGPAGLDYNQRDNILAVPNFYGNTVDFIPINVSSTGEIELPDSPGSLRNYPNPFNAYTVIEFSLDFPQNVILDIFDPLGRRIETLSEAGCQIGTHRVTWKTDGIASGVYYCRLSLINGTKIRKITLIK